MSADVVDLRPGSGPAATDFEREAVDTLLANIRVVRERSGADPCGVVFVVMADREGGGLTSKAGWYCEGGHTPLKIAYAATRLAREAAEP